MRRPIRRKTVPYKSPRLFTMFALLVCLFLMMSNLRNMRGPGILARPIISNLNEAVNQVEAPVNQQADGQQTDGESSNTQAPEPAASTDSNLDNSVPAADALQETLAGESNLSESSSLNLREDLILQDWLGLAQDGSLKMQKLEMPAYWRIMSIVKKSSFSDLLKAADSKMRFNDLYSSPSQHRSKLITLTVNIRKITRYDTDENPAEVQELFEVWGWSETSKAWLYVFVTPELPPGLDANTPVNQTAKFAGYFFKLQGYQPGAAKPNAKPLLAPLLIGKFELAKPAQRIAAAPAESIEWIIGTMVLVIGLVAIFLKVFVFRAKKPKLNHLRPSVKFDTYPGTPTDSRDDRR